MFYIKREYFQLYYSLSNFVAFEPSSLVLLIQQSHVHPSCRGCLNPPLMLSKSSEERAALLLITLMLFIFFWNTLKLHTLLYIQRVYFRLYYSLTNFVDFELSSLVLPNVQLHAHPSCRGCLNPPLMLSRSSEERKSLLLITLTLFIFFKIIISAYS